MPAKKKRTSTKKPTKKVHKLKEPVEEKETPQEGEETPPIPENTGDTVASPPQANSESQSDPAVPPQPAPPAAPILESGEIPQVITPPAATDGTTVPVDAGAQTPAPQVISTSGQVLPASGAPSTQPSGEIQPQQAPSVSATPNQTTVPAQPSTFQLDDAESGNKKNIILMILLILIIAALIGIGFVYRNAIIGVFSSKQATPTPTPAPASKEVPSPTKATGEVKLDAYSITVLNGSGTAGEASKVKDLLTEKGFKVETIGNADTSDYEETVIQAKNSIERDFLDSLKKALSETYTLDPVDSLSETNEADIVVTIGKNQKEQ